MFNRVYQTVSDGATGQHQRRARFELHKHVNQRGISLCKQILQAHQNSKRSLWRRSAEEKVPDGGNSYLVPFILNWNVYPQILLRCAVSQQFEHYLKEMGKVQVRNHPDSPKIMTQLYKRHHKATLFLQPDLQIYNHVQSFLTTLFEVVSLYKQ